MRLLQGYGRHALYAITMTVAGTVGGALLTTAAAGAPAEGTVRGAGGAGAIADRYIVVFKDGSDASYRVPSAATELAGRFGGTVRQSYDSAVRGFTARLSERSARRLAADPAVAYVEQDRVVSLAGTQTNPPAWGLDRIDQRDLPLSKSYTYPSAANVTAYIIDTGIRLTHSDLGGRARSGYDFIDNDGDASDCQGHGTHVAGTVGGTAYGVAKDLKLVAVRVLDCSGNGSYSQIIAGVDWVTRNAVKPAVANMSLGGSAGSTLDAAVKNSIASGVTYAVAAGNEKSDACDRSPARLAEAITVGATDSADARAAFSNYGTCVDIFAPGVNVLSSAKGDDTATTTMSGTSMATPHVAGAAALLLAVNPTATPKSVRDALVNGATTGKVTGPGTGSPNTLLYTGVTAPPVVPAVCSFTNNYARPVADRSTVESRLTVSGCGSTASVTSRVKVSIRHSDRGDLALTLLAPDGTAYPLKSAVSGDDVADLNTTYTVNASTERRDGVWKLRIVDRYSGDSGTLVSWALTL